MSADDIADSIKNTAKERLISPLGGLFTFAWFAWNHEFIIVVFSSATLSEKLAHIKQVLPTSIEYLFYWGIYPGTSAAVLILIYPILSYFASWWTHFWSNKLKRYQKENSIELVTPEELNTYYKEMENFKFSREHEEEKMRNEIKALVQERDRLFQTTKNYEKEMSKLRAVNAVLKPEEEKLVRLIGQAESLSISKEELIKHFVLNQNSFLVHTRRLQSDLGLITTDNKENITLTPQGCSAFANLGSANVKS